MRMVSQEQVKEGSRKGGRNNNWGRTSRAPYLKFEGSDEMEGRGWGERWYLGVRPRAP